MKRVQQQLSTNTRVNRGLAEASRRARVAPLAASVAVPPEALPAVRAMLLPEGSQPLDGVPPLTKAVVIERVDLTTQAFDILARGAGTSKVRILRGLMRAYCETGKAAQDRVNTALGYMATVGATAGVALRSAPKPIAFALALVAALQPNDWQRKFAARTKLVRLLNVQTAQLLAMAGDFSAVGRKVTALLGQDTGEDISLDVVVTMLRRLDEYTVVLVYACCVFYCMTAASAAVAATLYPDWDFPAIARPGHPVLRVLDELDTSYRSSATFLLWSSTHGQP